jgi:uncharacterized protein
LIFVKCERLSHRLHFGEMNPTHTNRLIHESSPYLLQHAHNPVDWYAWGPEAFEAARAQNKPIFMSVGYSTCYWCHVMERESFENEETAKLMNELFINIKVDREERPDVDQLYMTAVQVLTRHGGWPMSVFLTSDLKPFWGGTYFPPADAHGRPGFGTVLRAIAGHYQEKRDEVERTADELVKVLRQVAEPVGAERKITIDAAFLDRMIERSTNDYEPMYGGFGGAPKFPRETLVEMLLHRSAKPRSGGDDAVLKMTRHALDAMADGGIRDQLGGGFHRYSTDSKWLVPHFEIMLYDNAMLGWCYVEAHRQTKESRYATVARGVFDFILREMTSPSGAFYTAFDAEVDAREGLSYLWTTEEIETILGAEDAKVFNRVYGMDRGPNFADPHHGSTALTAGGTGQPDKSILYLPDGPAMESDPRIAEMRQKLYQARRQRKQPLLDTKVLTSWNALMIRAMAFGAKVLEEPRYLQAAMGAAEFLMKHHRKADGGLYRTSRLDAPEPSQAKLDGCLDDYAFFAQTLLELGESSGESRWREAAREIFEEMKARFADVAYGGFFFTDREATDAIVRQKTASDSPLPSGNAIAAMVAMELDQSDVARETLRVFAPQLEAHGEGMSAMVQAAGMYVEKFGSLEIAASEAGARRALSPQELAAAVVSLSGEWVEAKEFAIIVQICQGYHINTHRAAKDLIATEVLAGPEVEEVGYPAGEMKQLGFSQEPIEIYAGEVRIHVRLKEALSKAIALSLRYQACDESACLPPVTRRIQIPVE